MTDFNATIGYTLTQKPAKNWLIFLKNQKRKRLSFAAAREIYFP